MQSNECAATTLKLPKMQSNHSMKPPGALSGREPGTGTARGAGGGAFAAEDRLVDGAGGAPDS